MGDAAAFIDRDGVINADLGHVVQIEDFHLLPGAAAGLSRLSAAGYRLVVVTNQAGIAKGLYDEADYQRLTAHMRRILAGQGVGLAAVYHCPHHPAGVVEDLAVACACRKPAPGLLLRAASELGLDLASSVLVGDKLSDVGAAHAAGVPVAVLVESGHPLPEHVPDVAARCADLEAAADWIVNHLPRPGGA
jgi:D-glycero-D-manno-heptose 1,7-bisphosphate phosphatase